MPGLEAVAGSAYGVLVDAQLQQERDRKSSLEQRGLATVTAAGTLVSLLFAFGAFVHGSNPITLSWWTECLVVVALVGFVAACVAGVLTNRTAPYDEVDEAELARLTQPEFWSWDDTVGAARRVAIVKVSMVYTARLRNAEKANLLLASVSALAIAVALLGTALISVIAHGS